MSASVPAPPLPNAENRPITFTNNESNTVIECAYDYMGRRATKKVETNGETTLHQRYIYRAYLQIACCDLTRANHPCLWLITWDPTQPIATRPLAIQKSGTWYCYGWDLTKNICEVFGSNGYINTTYTYTPYGEVMEDGDISQSIQFSSEYADSELGLNYFINRYYSPMTGMWLGRDLIMEIGSEYNRYSYARKSPFIYVDIKGDFAWAIPLISSAALASALTAAAIVVGGAIAVYAVGVGAIKAAEWAKDKYRQKKCEKLQRQKHEAKKAAKNQACEGTVPCNPKPYQCREYLRRKRLFERLSSAREAYDRECFGGSDIGHDEAIKKVAKNAIKNCNEMYINCKRKLKN